MDETTKQALNAFVQQMISAAQNGAQWTADQAPLLVQDWLRWRAVEGFTYTLLWLIPIVGAWKLGTALIKTDDEEAIALAWGIRVLGCGLMSLALVGNLLNALQVLIAPRVVVLEKLAELVK